MKIVKTVGELMKLLSQFPQDTLISRCDSEWGHESIADVELREIDGQPWSIKGKIEAVVID